jgi:hypothetical protein
MLQVLLCKINIISFELNCCCNYYFSTMTLIFILMTLDIQTLVSVYHKSLESDIRGDTSGAFQRLLVSMCQGRRDENPVVDMNAAVADAQSLYRAGQCVMVDAQNEPALGRRRVAASGGRQQQYQNIVGMTPRGAAQSYDIVAAHCRPLLPAVARHRPLAALFCASTIKYIELLIFYSQIDIL